MLVQVRGIVEAIGKDWVRLDLNGWVIQACVPPSVLARARVGEPLTLHTTLVARMEGHGLVLTLYGFAEEDERELFEQLLTVNGVGPRAALALLGLSAPTLRAAIAQEQVDVLRRAPGIGPKTARAIILHLKDRIRVLPAPGVPVPRADDTEIIAALTALGYSVVEAQAALAHVPPDPNLPLEEKIRIALRYFARPTR
ncbi:Holliday junction ATP-dependent DNA helicase RuvA [Candidatus Thermoflexus japonica]|uniref:Holliday junction branch migration complex subunit RuvA n=1 Tax=Candidatus Thermoflexus japonica TaxID=2035417 RepID=A0A2H5Y2Z0_9CHLR|nr:Holliday junction ATP-dependent DNA helicase RuvA [Candidatus Thermoflexus japonica]